MSEIFSNLQTAIDFAKEAAAGLIFGVLLIAFAHYAGKKVSQLLQRS